MKKLSLLGMMLIAILALSTFAFADTYIIGDGTSTSGYCPFYGLWDYSWSKAIWTTTELNAAGVPADTPIIGIGFEVGNTPSNYTMEDQRIYVRTTTLTSYTEAEDETGTGYPDNTSFTCVFEGTLTYNGSGWRYIVLDPTFIWDGESNLEFLFENWDGDYVSGYPTFRYTSTSPDYRTVYKYQDNSFPAVAGTRSYNYRPNVAIITPSTTPPGAPELSLPADGAIMVSILPTFTWTAPTTGGLPTGYNVYLGESPALTDADIIAEVDATTLSYTVTTPLLNNTTYYWTVSAYNEIGDGPQANVRSFTTIEEGIFIIGEGISTTYYCPFNGLYDYSWSKAIWTAAELTAVGMPVDTEIIRIGFYVDNTPSNYTMLDQRIYVRTTELTSYTDATDETGTGYPDNTNFTNVFQGDLTYNGSGWHYITFTTPFSWDGTLNLEFLFENWDGDYVTGYPKFRYTSTTPDYRMVYKNQDNSFPAVAGIRNYNRPNIAIITPSTPTPGAPVLSAPADGATLVSITPTLSWTAPITGNLPTGYRIYLGTNPTLTTPFDEVDATTLSYTVTTPLLYNTTYYWTVSAFNDNGDGPQANVRSFTTFEQGYITIGTGIEDLALPIEPYYGYSYSQSIFLQSEINIADRPIEKICYYWNGAAAADNSNDWTVYMGNTDRTAFESTDDWIPIDNLTQVFSGEVDLPAVEGWIEIILDTPFYHNGQNIVIAIDENEDGYNSTSEYFYCTLVETKENRSIRYYSDVTNPDPAAPPTGTLVAGYPNIMLKFEEEQPPLPVELSSFTAVLTNELYVQLTWVSQSETNLSGYRVYRNEEKSLDNAILITPTMIPATNTTQEQSYTIVDSEVEIHTTYYYWLESVDYNNSEFHGPVIVTVEGNVPPVLPEVTTLNNAYPNPFRANNSTKIEVGIKAGETGTLTIYNIRGEVVKAVKLTQGYHTINWDGIDSKGKTCGSGIYFYRLNTPSLNQIKKMVIIK